VIAALATPVAQAGTGDAWGLSAVHFLAGEATGKLLLDTGAGVTCVTKGYLERAGLLAGIKVHKRVEDSTKVVVANGNHVVSHGTIDLEITLSLMLDVGEGPTPIWVNWIRLVVLRNVLVLPLSEASLSDLYVAYSDWNLKGVKGVVPPLGQLADLVMKGARISNSPRAPKVGDGTTRVVRMEVPGVASMHVDKGGTAGLHPGDMSAAQLKEAILGRIPEKKRGTSVASKLVAMLLEHRKIFDRVKIDETTEVVEFTLKEGAVPNPVSFKVNMPRGVKHDAVIKGLTEWLDSGICEKVDWKEHAYGFVIVVPKAGGKFRVTINPMELNRVTNRVDPQGGVMPDNMIREALKAGQGGQFGALMDFAEAFTCMKLGATASELSTFTTPLGKLRWKQGFFGWHSFPAIFQRMMMEQIVLPTLDEVKSATLVAWIDDLFVGDKDEDAWVAAILSVVLKGLQKGLRLNLPKCFWLWDTFDICGVEVNVVTNAWRISPKRVESLRTIPVPEDRETLVHLLGMLRYYYFGVHNQLAQRERLAKLQELDVAGTIVKSAWTEEHTRAMKGAIEEVIAGKWLMVFDPRKKVYVWTDASGSHGYAVVVCQYDDASGELRPIAVYSAGWLSTQLLWPAQAKECYAQRQAVAVYMWEAFPHADVVLLTDNKNLAHDADSVDLRVKRWRNDIWETGCLVRRWIAGKDNNIADFMSRIMKAQPTAALPVDSVLHQMMAFRAGTEAFKEEEEGLPRMAVVGPPKAVVEGVVVGQGDNVVPGHLAMAPLLSSIVDGQDNAPAAERAKWHGNEYSTAVMAGRKFSMWKNRVIIPEGCTEIKAVVLRLAHDAAMHYTGASRTQWAIENQARVHWVNIHNDVEQYVRSCFGCAMAKGQHVYFGAGTLSPTVAPYVHHTWYVDVKGPLPNNTGSILVIVEALSRYVRLRYINNSSAKEVNEELQEAINDYGTRPVVIRSDGGQPFNSDEYNAMCKAEGIKPVIGSPYHSPGQGAVETKIREIAAAIIATLGGRAQTAWFKGQTLMKLESIINSSVVGHLGMSPYRIMYGREPRTALAAKLDWRSEDYGRMVLGDETWTLEGVNNIIAVHHKTIESLQTLAQLETSVSQALTKRAFDAKRKPGAIGVGQYVIVLTTAPNRLAPWYTGPYLVTEVSSDGNFLYGTDFMDTKKIKKGPFHVMRAKVFDMSRTTIGIVGAYQMQEGWGFIESVVGHRVLGDKSYQFNIRWVGVEDTTWSAEDNVQGLTKVKEYCALNGLPDPSAAPVIVENAGKRKTRKKSG
jgi:hypothetical protein